MKHILKKLLAIILSFAIISPSFSYVPLSNSQNNLGSYQNAATQGMFYNELDILSSYPVELIDFEGNCLYTNWSNARNYTASNVTYPTPLSWGNNVNNANLSVLQLGITGNPLSYFNIDDTRAGIIYQFFGGLTNTINLDGAGANESEYTRINITNIPTSPTDVTPIRVRTENTNVKYYQKTINNQINFGLAKKSLILDNLAVGFSFVNTGNTIILNSAGTKSYTDRYLTDAGATGAGMPATAREGNTYTATYEPNTTDQNSTINTSLLAQARYSELLDNLSITAAAGLQFANTINPGGLLDATGAAQGILEKNIVTISAKDDTNIAGTQYYNYGTSIKNRTAFNYATNPTLANFGSAVVAVWDGTTGVASGVVDFSDKRSGLGPTLNIEGVYKLDNVNLTGVVNFDTVKQNIDATQTNREYINTKTVNPGTPTEVRDYTEIDYTETIKSEGAATNTNIDFGIKVELKTLEKIKLALGGFIRNNINLAEFSKVSVNIVSKTSYDDGNAANNPGTVGLLVLPGPAAGDGFGVTAGSGEGVHITTTNREFSGKTEILTTNYTIPIGMEIPLYKNKWLFRAGTQFNLQTTKTTVKSVREYSKTSTSVTPAGAATLTAEAIDNQPLTTENVTYAETYTTTYTYGIQWNVNKSLVLAANAVLDTNPNLGADKATIFDLDTFRNLSIQAVFKF